MEDKKIIGLRSYVLNDKVQNVETVTHDMLYDAPFSEAVYSYSGAH